MRGFTRTIERIMMRNLDPPRPQRRPHQRKRAQYVWRAPDARPRNASAAKLDRGVPIPIQFQKEAAVIGVAANERRATGHGHGFGLFPTRP